MEEKAIKEATESSRRELVVAMKEAEDLLLDMFYYFEEMANEHQDAERSGLEYCRSELAHVVSHLHINYFALDNE